MVVGVDKFTLLLLFSSSFVIKKSVYELPMPTVIQTNIHKKEREREIRQQLSLYFSGLIMTSAIVRHATTSATVSLAWRILKKILFTIFAAITSRLLNMFKN